MTSVIFATPTLSHAVSLEYLRSTIETQWALAGAKIPSGFITRGGDCFVAKVRNKIVTEFLRDFPTATDLFFIDDDIGWPAAKVIEFLNRREDIVAGIYPKKSEQIDFPVELAADPGTGRLFERDGLVRAIAGPTGFLRIKRHVLEKMAAVSQTFRDIELDGSDREYYGLFETGIGTNGWWWGEDYTFCQKWGAMGGEIWVDPSIEFTHRGQRKWTATLSDHLQTFRDRAALATVDAIDLNQGRVAA